MFWADKIAQEIAKSGRPQLVEDAKTPSGKVHVGALRGVIIHDLIFKALKEAKVACRYTYIIDDMDPLDDIPVYLPKQKYEKFMGVSLKDIPSPNALSTFEARASDSRAKSFAEYYADEFIEVFNNLGARPQILYDSKLYKEGRLDKYIKLALDNAEKIQKIYEKISGSRRPKDFLPFQPVCENCGKIGTTIANNWDGKFVSYECSEQKVTWAKGCNYKGKVSPFGGNGKLPWRVEWPAKWASLGVTVEGEGKDHASRGGTRDTANAIAKDIFGYEPPYDIPYEHFLFGGKKMSSSKGIGPSASEVSEILPPEVLRFLMVKVRPMQHIEFDPSSEHFIPNLFDEFDSARNSKDAYLRRIYELSLVKRRPKKYFVPRFRDLINLVQLPGLNLVLEAAKKKGKTLTKEEKGLLEERVMYVKIYLDRFAPERVKFTIKEDLPVESGKLSSTQKKLLGKLINLVSTAKDPERFQNEIYQIGKDLGLSSAETFEAIYIPLLGKEFGPKAAWLILSLDKSFVKKRFREAAS